MQRVIVLIILVFALIPCDRAITYARGQTPPAPPFSGGNAGGWLPRGPIFDFDNGGGPGGGWGAGYYENGGWDGWGWGSGGGGYGGFGGGGGNGQGDLFDTTAINPGRKPSDYFGNCYRMTETGNYNACGCWYSYDPMFPPCSGCPVHGICGEADYGEDGGSDCDDSGDICTGIAD